MRVLLVADVVGGVRTFVRELARVLPAHGVELHLALLGPDGERGLGRTGAASCTVRDLRLEWMEDSCADVAATSEWVEELRERHRPDVLHMNTFAPVLCPHVPVLLTVHSCVLTWWRAVHGSQAPAQWHAYGALAKRALQRADLVATPTRALLDDLASVHGSWLQGQVIPNGRSPTRTGATRILAGTWAGREPLVVSVGRLWDEAKNAALLASAAPRIQGDVVLIGPGSIPGVRALGELGETEVHGWLSRAAVFAEPARYEPFGFAALEAALCGCALVLGDIPSLREVWGSAASFVSPDDPDALAHAVNRLLADPVLRARAARDALAAASRYTPRAMATAYLETYERLLAAVPA